MRRLETAEDFAKVRDLSSERPVMLLKHSTRCPVSALAHRQFSEYAEEAASRGVECAVVLVVEDRDLSRQIADDLSVPHQSPQAILLRGGRVTWDASHRAVTIATLRRAEVAEDPAPEER